MQNAFSCFADHAVRIFAPSHIPHEDVPRVIERNPPFISLSPTWLPKRSTCSLWLCAGHGVLAVSEDHVPFSEPCFTTGNDVLFVFVFFFFS